MTGRRRVGKTELLKRAFGDGKTPCLYLLVTRKTEKVQCAAFQQEVEKVLGVRIPGKCERFKEAFFAKNPDLKDRKVSFRALSLKDM